MIWEGATAQRTHYVHVAAAQFVFWHDEHGLVFVDELIAIEDAASYGLQPVLLYVVSAEGAPIRWLHFSKLKSPLPLQHILSTGWRDATGLRGYPDTLVLCSHLADSAPLVAKNLTRHGIAIAAADSSDMRVAAMLRSAQSDVVDLATHCLRERPDKQDEVRTLDELNRLATLVHNFHWQVHDSGEGLPRARRLNLLAWHDLEPRPFPHRIENCHDWTPGPWLWGWSKAVKDAGPRDFYEDYNAVWLLGEEDDEAPSDYEEALAGGRNLIRLLLKVWPNPGVEIARMVGLHLQDLKSYVVGKSRLDVAVLEALFRLLGIECYPADNWQLTGPIVLRGTARNPLMRAYDELRAGGDYSQHPCELVPEDAPADASWRYILIPSRFDPPSFIMIARDSEAADALDSGEFDNHDGKWPVSPEFYNAMVSACTRACEYPAANRREIATFALAHREALRKVQLGIPD